MRFKKYISFFLISVLIYSLSGCGNKNTQVSNNLDNNKKIEVTIKPEIDMYSPMMSSVPGIPLTIVLNGNTSKGNIKFHWVTEQGTFLNWQQVDGKISNLGKDITISEQKIFWSIDPNAKLNESSFKIHLKIEDNDTSKVIYETSIEIEQKKVGFFSVKKL